MKPANVPGAEERYVQHKKNSFDDNLSDRSSIDEYYLLPEHKKDDFETKSFESHELDELNSTASTPASMRKTDIITSTEISVPGTIFTNPMALKSDNIERLSNFEGSIEEIWNKASDNSNNNNGKLLLIFFTCMSVKPNYLDNRHVAQNSRFTIFVSAATDLEAGFSLPNMVPDPQHVSTSRPGTGNRPLSRPPTGTRSSNRPGTGTRPSSRPGTGSNSINSFNHQKLENMVVEEL